MNCLKNSFSPMSFRNDGTENMFFDSVVLAYCLFSRVTTKRHRTKFFKK